MEELIGWLLFKPFFGFFQAVVFLLAPVKTERQRWLQRFIAASLVLAVAGAAALVVSLWSRLSVPFTLTAAMIAIASCYVGGFLAGLIERE